MTVADVVQQSKAAVEIKLSCLEPMGTLEEVHKAQTLFLSIPWTCC